MFYRHFKCIAVIALFLSACRNPNCTKTGNVNPPNDTFSRFIPMDTANKMISSYLNSINYQQNDTDLQSLIVNVDQLRAFIDGNNGRNITHLKLMFAHTLAYTNSNKVNTYAGYKANALTLIIAAYDSTGHYVYYPVNSVLDYTQPCPPVCPSGNAGSPLLTN